MVQKFVSCLLVIFGLISVCATVAVGARQDDPAKQEPPVLKYTFSKDQKIGYEFDAESTIDNSTTKTSGFATYELNDTDVPNDLDGDSLREHEFGETTSTAFVVTSDGFMVTCAHCVEGAEKLKIRVGEKVYDAEIIQSEPDFDLAIVKINATDLPIVKLGESKTVQLAQDVRAIGYPLSSLLGNSVKIIAGSVAGFVDAQGVTNLQIDGAVNPGNSGGPLVNEQGHVVGVVNAKLSGESISKVGFAVPIQYVKKMLDANSIKYSVAGQAKPLSGPELATKLTPAVGFVEAKMGKDGFNSFRNFSISISGTMSRSNESDSRPQREVIQSELILDPHGSVVDIESQINLPLLMGPVASLPFEPLPRLTRNQWSKVENLILPIPDEMPRSLRQSANRADPFDFGIGPRFNHPDFGIGPRFNHPGFRFGPGQRFGAPTKPPETKTRMAMATRVLKYEIIGREDTLVTIAQTQTFETDDDDDEFANLRIRTESELEFDLEKGIFVSKKMSGNVKFKLGGDNHIFPIKLSYRMVNLDDLFADSQPKMKLDLLSDSAVGLTDEQLDRFIETHDGLPEQELLEYLNMLAKWDKAPELSAKIEDAIKKVLQSGNSRTHKPAIDALLNWRPDAATPYVIKGFENASAFSKRTWMLKLGKTGDERAAIILCDSLNASGQRVVAMSALKQLGAVAELSVISALNNNLTDAGISDACLEVLGEIGSDKSVALIQQILDSQSVWPSRSRAEKTLKSIKSRGR